MRTARPGAPSPPTEITLPLQIPRSSLLAMLLLLAAATLSACACTRPDSTRCERGAYLGGGGGTNTR
jgi:hypothetical protein